MSDDTAKRAKGRDYRDTVFLPKTDFPMKAGLPAKEPGILARWEDAKLYKQLREARTGREKFILHDGPPYANGNIHIGHALNKVLKDAVVRTQSLLGKDAPYVPGWDCHGLPIEWKVEEKYRKKKLNKDEVPAREFRQECREYAAEWVDVQREQFKRLGVAGEWDKPYLTMAPEAEAGIVTELLKFATSGQLYRGAKPVMWSPVEKTALAEAEVEYEDITSTQIDVAFEIVESPIEELVGAHAVIWTTTPWTIPVNQALAYGKGIEYVLFRPFITIVGASTSFPDAAVAKIQSSGFVMASPLVDDFCIRLASYLTREWFGVGGNTVKVTPVEPTKKVFSGSDLAGTIARHPMHKLGGFFTEPRPLLPGDFVTTDSGTGLVHMAPDHGEDDFDLCKANGISPKFVVDADGRYREEWLWLPRTDERSGSVINPKFNAPDGPICSDLREAGALLSASADYGHSYPHSWRSKAKVIYRCTPQWFVPMDKLQGDATLRETALTEIDTTRFVPAKGKNRIGSMVEGKPDWVLSRQRAWGVPITLFVDRKSGEYLVDPAVNARIIETINADGVDGWCEENAAMLLGPDRNPDDYEMITDILDVWFDSGCTHAFVLESDNWPDLRSPADLYLEGSDQHRGWFQSSLVESCATRGVAPYKAVLTHGFTMAADGRKMSKSLGNTVDPLKVMEEYGADIIRMWALSVDYTEDHRIGPEILKGVADQYRKLRNTFRYMLGGLQGFAESERVYVADMPELERYMLSLLGELDTKLRKAVDDFDFNTYTRALTEFANEDLSAFFFDIRKDRLYCDAPDGQERRAYRTALDVLFNALIRYAAPVLVFTAEEVWGTRHPEGSSVHLLEWPEVPRATADASRWDALRALRERVTEAIEPLRREKTIRSGLEAEVTVPASTVPEGFSPSDLAELFITGNVTPGDGDEVIVTKTSDAKCGRCWRLLPEVAEDGELCNRCESVVRDMDAGK
ncbi:isoleucyl-tRNA synthetase [Aurantiacibacter atlanticus]|uniref:Isoleucine--tRNA ligase n=1 Tax=Aurantiacibacter atlanticus TaxID=1648404 RepID=A0A0H4VE74_9SPHN|nr:isoleucine--tRNA ligase [Aurantiacibacter atlanticus]AKQ41156.1 isoleucyl-tRNA synthetase [Aurantiacibacter atlanticus]MDF1834927.1 isoleucine--tRNA ligase [Alteraurantiacibacter sp. bin_em_oilr2.035]